MFTKILGVDVGGTYTRAGIVEYAGGDPVVTDFAVRQTDELCAGGGFIDGLTNFLAEMSRGKGCKAVSAGFPATIDKARKRVLSAPNIAGLDDCPAADILSERLQMPAFIDKDVNHLLMRDIRRLRVAETSTALGFYFGTGLGNAIFMNGGIVYGANGAAGELGHIPTRGGTEPCGCGNMGCAENYMSGKALSRLRDELFPNTPMGELFVKHGGHAEIARFIEDLAVPIATEINILDPDCVIIGGGLAEMEGFPFKPLENAVYARTRKPYPVCALSVLRAPADRQSGVIGAAICAFAQLSAKGVSA